MREKKIVQLLEKCTSYMSSEELASALKVSTRTIMNDIRNLMNDSHHHGFEINIKRGQGYYLEIINDEQFATYRADDQETPNGKQRIPYILARLLLKDEYISQEELAAYFMVSKPIIKADMMKVQNILLEHHIELERKAHYGIRIITRSYHRKELLQELYEQNEHSVRKNIDDMLQDKFQNVEKKLIMLLKKHERNTNYNELKKIDAFLKIGIYTNKEKLVEDIPFKKSDTIYYEMASELMAYISEIYNLKFCESEVHDLGYYLRIKTKPSNLTLVYHEGLEKTIETFLQQTDYEYRTSFNQDQQFKESLLAHVSLLLDRLHQSISFSNPLVNEISVKYPIIFNIAIKFTKVLEQRYQVHVTQDEIGFIATHFAAHMEKEARHKLSHFNRIAILCSSGGGSAFLIKLKLESLFTKSDIQTFSLLEQDDVRQFHPDIIFTITDLQDHYDVPIIRINELLDDMDILKIKNMFNLSKYMPQTWNVLELFQKDCFFIFEKEKEYETALRTMATSLEAKQYAKEGYCSYMMQREKYLSTIYSNGVAIPHPMEMCGLKNTISVGIIKNNIEQDGKQPKIVFMVSLVKADVNLHELITRVLFQVMENEKLVAQLRNVKSFEEFMILLHEIKS